MESHSFFAAVAVALLTKQIPTVAAPGNIFQQEQLSINEISAL